MGENTGKRKPSGSSKPAARPRKVPRPAGASAASFTCPFCGHPGTTCRIDLVLRIAKAECDACWDGYVTGAHALTAAADVYAASADACRCADVGVAAAAAR